MATLSAAAPGSNQALAAQRKWRWAAILLQLETLGALVVGAMYLLRSPGTFSPQTALMVLVVASLLFPLGTAIERGNRGAGLVLAAGYCLHAFQFAVASVSVMMWLGPLLLLEGFVFGRAVVAMTDPAAPLPEHAPQGRSKSLAITIIPIFAALYLMAGAGRAYERISILGTLDEALVAVRAIGALLILGGIALAMLHRLPSRISLAVRGRDIDVTLPRVRLPWTFDTIAKRVRIKLPWTLQVRLDFTIGVVILALSIWVLDYMFDAMSGSGAMLSAGVLIFPIVALLCLPLGLVWFVVGIAEIHEKKWARRLRIAAAIPSVMVAFAAAPILLDLAKLMVTRWVT